MGYKTTVSRKLSCPIYGAWKCSKCGTVTFTEGYYLYYSSAMVGGINPQNRYDKANEIAKRHETEGWIYNALIDLKKYNGRNSKIVLEKCKCSKCGHKERWGKLQNILRLKRFLLNDAVGLYPLYGCIFLWLLFAIVMFFLINPFITVIGIATLIGVIIIIVLKNKYLGNRKVKENIPILGTLNPEVCNYADIVHEELLSPEHVVIFVDNKYK